MKLNILFVLTILSFTLSLNAQVKMQWSVRDTSEGGRSNQIVVDDAKNLYSCGEVGNTFTLLKYDENGLVIWKKQPVTGEGFDLVFKDNSNIYVSGINTSGGSKSILIIKYNDRGDEVWSRSSAQDNNLNQYSEIASDNLGNVVLNYSSTDTLVSQTTFYTKKYDSDGNVIFSYDRILPGRGNSKIGTDASGNVYVLYLESFVIEKLSSSGNILWTNEFNPSGDNIAANLYVDAGSNVYVIGTQNNSATGNDFVTIKYSSSGLEQWHTFYDNNAVNDNNSDIGVSITADNNGNVISSGDSRTGLQPRSSNITVKYTPDGSKLWDINSEYTRTISSTRNVQIDNDGNIYVLSRITSTSPVPGRSSAHIFKYNTTGELQWDEQGFSNYYDNPMDLKLDNNYNVYTVGRAGNPLIGDCFTVVKYTQTGTVGIINTTLPSAFSIEQNYPNPFNPSTTIKFSIPAKANVSLSVYDVSGKLVEKLLDKKEFNAGAFSQSFNGASLSSGVYYYSLQVDNYPVITKKMMLIK